MSEIRKQKRWFEQLNRELSHYFEDDETREIMSYYEEMFHDKLEDGKDLDDIIDQYDPKRIARQMIPRVVSGRRVETSSTKNNAKLIVLILFSTPILIPLGVVYISLIITGLSLVISGIALIGSAGIGLVVSLIRVFLLGLALPEMLVSLGTLCLGFSLMPVIGYYLYKISWQAVQVLSIWISKLINRKGNI